MVSSSTSSPDPWSQVDDLFGDALYRTLGIPPSATSSEIKQAYRERIKTQHPDKGGTAAGFAVTRHAFDTLGDPSKRAVYDSWASELRFRYVQGVAAKAHGGEGILLDQLAEMGLACDSETQLVVVCEVCSRPATKECWTCGMKICDFCTLKRHWRENFQLHWPLINSNHMATQLAKRELEKKRVEDANRRDMKDPNFRGERERRDIRAFQDAACRMSARPDRLVFYDQQLARYYMWAQTDSAVFIACHVPQGRQDAELLLDCTAHALTLQSADGSLPMIERTLDKSINCSSDLETFRTPDNRQFAISLPKAEHVTWQRLFRGDSDGARCMQQPHRMTEAEDSVTLEFELPFWIGEEDVDVQITGSQLSVGVRNELNFRRTYWRNREEEDRSSDYAVVDVAESLWSLDDDSDAAGRKMQLLTVQLAKPAPRLEDVTWKKGKRQDNRAASRPGGMQQKGVRFFVEDEDEFALEEMLQALCMRQAGCTWVPAKPWHYGTSSKLVKDRLLLSNSAQKHLELLA